MTKKEIRERMSVLCMYAPYGLKVKHDLQDFPCELHDIDLYRGSVECVPVGEKAYLGTQHFHVEFVKPILRTMESMTDAEKKEWNTVSSYGELLWVSKDGSLNELEINIGFFKKAVMWLCERKIDCMGLIPRGLAVDVKTIKGGQYE